MANYLLILLHGQFPCNKIPALSHQAVIIYCLAEFIVAINIISLSFDEAEFVDQLTELIINAHLTRSKIESFNTNGSLIRKGIGDYLNRDLITC